MSDKDVGTLISAVFAILYLVICGHLGAHVAIQKGRRWVEGASFGVLLGPLGAIAVALLPTLEARVWVPPPQPTILPMNGDLSTEEVAEFLTMFEEAIPPTFFRDRKEFHDSYSRLRAATDAAGYANGEE
jgi:hypothetical protein